MDINTIKKELKGQLGLSLNKTIHSLQILLVSDSMTFDEFILQKARFVKLEEDKKNGLIPTSEYEIILQKIRVSINAIINDLTEKKIYERTFFSDKHYLKQPFHDSYTNLGDYDVERTLNWIKSRLSIFGRSALFENEDDEIIVRKNYNMNFDLLGGLSISHLEESYNAVPPGPTSICKGNFQLSWNNSHEFFLEDIAEISIGPTKSKDVLYDEDLLFIEFETINKNSLIKRIIAPNGDDMEIHFDVTYWCRIPIVRKEVGLRIFNAFKHAHHLITR